MINTGIEDKEYEDRVITYLEGSNHCVSEEKESDLSRV